MESECELQVQLSRSGQLVGAEPGARIHSDMDNDSEYDSEASRSDS